jgi:hypothetical protein
MNGNHLHIHALRVHILQALLRREPELGRRDEAVLPLHDQQPGAISGLMPYRMPGTAGCNGPPQPLGHEMSVDVYRAHEISS